MTIALAAIQHRWDRACNLRTDYLFFERMHYVETGRAVSSAVSMSLSKQVT